MDIRLHHVLPQPLQDKPMAAGSDIWGKDITLPENSLIKVTAASGRGKTTLVHFIAGLRKDYSGKIQLGNSDPANCPIEELALIRREKLAIVFQDLRLFPDLTIRENTELKKYLPAEPARDLPIEDMATRLGIDSLLNTKAGICSYGEQQRVAIQRALVQPFQWLILDEPFSHLDKSNRKKAIELMQSIVDQRKAGIILLDLEPDNYFPYHQQLQL